MLRVTQQCGGVRLTIVAVEIQHYVPFVLLLTYTAVVINIKALIVAMEMQQWLTLLCCRVSFSTTVNSVHFVM